MNEFVASNGMVVSPDSDGDLRLLSPSRRNTLDQAPFLDGDEIDALREFFQAEADERLGRFRTADVPEYVVYSRRGLDGAITHCFVVHETTGHGTEFKRGVRDEGDDYPYQRAARAYFDAHPEPKPWHDAKPGEVWVLTHVKGETSAFIVGGHRFESGAWSLPFDAPSITAGRRIFPEELAS